MKLTWYDVPSGAVEAPFNAEVRLAAEYVVVRGVWALNEHKRLWNVLRVEEYPVDVDFDVLKANLCMLAEARYCNGTPAT